MGILENPFYQEPNVDQANFIERNQGFTFKSDFNESIENL